MGIYVTEAKEAVVVFVFTVVDKNQRLTFKSELNFGAEYGFY